MLKLQPGGEEFLIVAGAGIREEHIGAATVPAGHGSQSGHTLATGTAAVVTDWRQETRFAKSGVADEYGALSGATVLIRAKASALGIAVVAEGVETREQLLATRALGCGFAQGFYFSEPIPAEEVEALLREPMRTAS